ncbi:DNA polymerase III subunit epsilon [Methyloversatilis thermotolerans]|uniref:DNA polymerase III subunit epsilon n=1 Tax=Methyloversatilis thermotolerans TaxID=1346290 RepID=UPI0003610661|nr:DNA polymerase III subunit epsilon [Methyloversatilis thermotolerans]
MTRQIVLDTETTGLEWQNGDRLIELGCVELVGRKRTGRHLHLYVNPEREVPEGAVAVHGITTEFLADKPRFRDVVDQFVDFVRGAELIIHNAAFDVGFLDNELSIVKRSPLREICVWPAIDTVRMARDMFPGKRANLDALCERFGIENSHREFHGALLDAELLVEVYLAMTRGQESLIIDLEPEPAAVRAAAAARPRGALRQVRATAEEIAEHERVLADIDKASGGATVWRSLEPATTN